jgi:hypothetical protein
MQLLGNLLQLTQLLLQKFIQRLVIGLQQMLQLNNFLLIFLYRYGFHALFVLYTRVGIYLLVVGVKTKVL